jgi:nicotinamide phosphoribosyltransferase
MINRLIDSDSYKASHYLQYPPGTEYISSYIESRGGEYDFTLFFGLQGYLKRYLNKPITRREIDEAEEITLAHGLPFNRAGWDHILNKHGGRLPISIQAVKEGTVLPTKNVLVQVVNTDPQVPWLTSFMETALLRSIWYATTVATRSKHIKNIIKTALDKTSDDPEGQIGFKLHDFGFRGVSSRESGMIGGTAHLVNFMGSDTMGALYYARKYYGASMAGFSIPASEHSTITSWGKAKEAEAYRNMIEQFGQPGKLVAVVSDSYDIYNAIDKIWGDSLKQQVIDSGATIVVRPDSGDPTKVPVECVVRLANAFGATTNKKGYLVLPPCVRVIQGDGINEHSIKAIIAGLMDQGFSIDNIAFGMGGELLQTPNRDTLKFAMKASAIKTSSGYWKPIYKDPITDSGKQSKRGRLALIKEGGNYSTVREEERAGGTNLLEPVYLNGKILRNQTLDDIRTLSNS